MTSGDLNEACKNFQSLVLKKGSGTELQDMIYEPGRLQLNISLWIGQFFFTET
jgi:hypothetical protein